MKFFWLVSFVLCAVIAGTLIYLISDYRVSQQRYAPRYAEYKAQRDELLSDPIVSDLVSRGNAKCPDADTSFVWSCGVLLEFDGVSVNRHCSTRDQPRYAGSLSPIRPDDEALSWSWAAEYHLSPEGLQNCGVSGEAQKRNCFTLQLLGPPRSEWGYPPESPPSFLSPQPIVPDYPNIEPRHTLSVDSWVNFEGMPVAFFFSQWIPSRLAEKTQPDRCILSTNHPSLPLNLNLGIPCDKLADWRVTLRGALQGIEDAVRHRDVDAICGEPPLDVRLGVNPYNSDRVKQIRDWLRVRHEESDRSREP